MYFFQYTQHGFRRISIISCVFHEYWWSYYVLQPRCSSLIPTQKHSTGQSVPTTTLSTHLRSSFEKQQLLCQVFGSDYKCSLHGHHWLVAGPVESHTLSQLNPELWTRCHDSFGSINSSAAVNQAGSLDLTRKQHGKQQRLLPAGTAPGVGEREKLL